MMKNAFCFILKALFVLKIFKILSWLFVHLEKTIRLERQGYDVTTWLTNNCNTHTDQYLRKLKQPGNETWSIDRL